MYLSARARLILEYVLMNKKKVTSKVLATEMDVSERTIRRDLSEVEAVLGSYHLELVRTGNELTIEGTETDRQNFKWQLLDLSYNEFTPLERQNFILKTLLREDQPVKLIALANDLSVTISTVSNDLMKLEDELGVEVLIERKRGSGILLQASENKKREMMSDLLNQTLPKNTLYQYFNQQMAESEVKTLVEDRLLNLLNTTLLNRVEEVLRRWRQELSYDITDDAYLTLIVHIAISVERLVNGKHSVEIPVNLAAVAEYQEYQQAKELLADCLEMEAHVVPDGEAAYVTMHLRGVKTQEEESSLSGNEAIQAITLATRLIAKVSSQIDTPLEEPALLTGLVAHLRSALRRLDEGMRIQNPLVESIKQDYPDLFKVIRRAFDEVYPRKKAPDEEIGYLVLHFGATILQLKKQASFRGLVVCSSGIGTSKMLVTRLQQALPQLKSLKSTSLFEMLHQEQAGFYDVIVSTIDLGKVDFDYFLVSPILTQREIAQIEVYLQQKQGVYPKKAIKQVEKFNLIESVHHLEKMKAQIDTVLAVLKTFQVFPIDQVEGSLEDVIRAICMVIFQDEQDLHVEVLVRFLMERETWGGFGIPETRLALFHVRNEYVHHPLFQVFPLKRPMFVPSMDGGEVEVSTLLVLLAPEKLSAYNLEVLSYISAMIIDSDETIATFESGDSSKITPLVIQKLYQLMNQ
ncbi:BglG family transcription antiterminator [Carnobacterium gallinarum]|uniref:BglG family transcription antiterminator n=1 Tax=Carnobacterium gallinarum TaxID=2749 RepID=UPI0005506510|nr:BglG family transcription antiterminator [Carnobacterium gallinarum]